MSLNIFQLLDLKKGFSLPIWVAGAAKSALKKLVGLSFEDYELIKIPNQQEHIKIPVHAASVISNSSYALGISFANSGLDLDLTQNLEIWTIVSLEESLINNQSPKNKIKLLQDKELNSKDNKRDMYFNFCKRGFI